MTRLIGFLRAQPVAVNTAVAAVVKALVATKVWHLDGPALAAILQAYDAVTVVLVWNAVTPNVKAEQKAVEAADSREEGIRTFLEGARRREPLRAPGGVRD